MRFLAFLVLRFSCAGAAAAAAAGAAGAAAAAAANRLAYGICAHQFLAEAAREL